MRTTSLWVLLAFSTGLINLKGQATFRNRNIVDAIDMVNVRYAIKGGGTEYDGSPYEQEAFVWGVIYYRDEATEHRVPVRYNIFDDNMEYFRNKAIMELLAYPVVDSVVTADATYLFGMLEAEGNNGGYFKLLVEGDRRLLAKSRVKFFDRVAAKPMQEEKPPRFERRNDRYYVELSDGSIHSIGSWKKLIPILGLDTQDLQAYVKAHRLSTKKAEDLISFFRYINMGK